MLAWVWFLIGLAAGVAGGFAVAAKMARSRAYADRRKHSATAERDLQEQQSALLGHLASGLAHEIRNPLSTLSINLQLLREDWGRPVTEREQRGARRIDTLLRETERLERVLDDLLRFAAGHQLRLERRDLNAVVDELADFYTPQAERFRIRLVRDLAPGLPLAEFDANLLRQALHNLLLNAQQAMPQGGEIRVRTSSPRPGAVRVEVSDTGPGIPPDSIDKIFNLYYSTKPGGTGLGLPMAKKIVEEHRGTIAVESAPGQGTAFTVTLPVLDARR